MSGDNFFHQTLSELPVHHIPRSSSCDGFFSDGDRMHVTGWFVASIHHRRLYSSLIHRGVSILLRSTAGAPPLLHAWSSSSLREPLTDRCDFQGPGAGRCGQPRWPAVAAGASQLAVSAAARPARRRLTGQAQPGRASAGCPAGRPGPGQPSCPYRSGPAGREAAGARAAQAPLVTAGLVGRPAPGCSPRLLPWAPGSGGRR
ncbi:hypothetical protein Bca52824_032883 [Brassica carinata]|uniref:Uncharacterized protein n=1 Tax=Brassica carinata TaxID=52824 RepID=A0A8X7V6R0_BRACI|nr:hypothetical protein Bca52824_032883 [Brassica carinata]